MGSECTCLAVIKSLESQDVLPLMRLQGLGFVESLAPLVSRGTGLPRVVSVLALPLAPSRRDPACRSALLWLDELSCVILFNMCSFAVSVSSLEWMC